MRTQKTYFWWAVYLVGGGMLISLVVTVGLLTGFMTPLVLAPRLCLIPFGLLATSLLCMVASIALLVRGLTLRTKVAEVKELPSL